MSSSLGPSRIYSPHDSLRPVGRISIFPVASARILAVTLLVSFLPGVRATCWINSSGEEVCDGLTDAARVGIGIAFFLLFLAVILALMGYRRRRAAQANLAYIQQTHPGGGSVYGGPYGGPPFAPQYPPPAHNGVGSPYYDPATGFAQPTASPPQYYAPPPGAPPFSPPK
jgi:hypothetical protein